MIYFYGALLIANILHGTIAIIAGDYEALRHAEIITFLILIVIYFETEEKK